VAGLVVRLGVTGHRAFDDDEADVVAAVDAVLDRLAGTFEVRSSLAEGADRLVVDRALRRPGSRLVAVLPLEVDDYATDFDGTVEAFRSLLDRAASVEVVEPQPTREAAYERAGRAVVDGSDVLLALWDGAASRGRGGTAEIVDYARERGVPVEVVTVGRS
jgi:hypothetical protein